MTSSRKSRKPSDLAIRYHRQDPSRIVWSSMVPDIVAGHGSLTGHYTWPDGESGTLLERAWSAPAERSSWADVKPFIEACLERGPSPYLVSPVLSVLAVVQDPAKLQGWLDLGMDPCALHNGQPVWWDLVHRGDQALLDQMSTDPAWRRGLHAHNATGVSVLTRWANGGDPEAKGQSVASSLTLLRWLQQHLGPRHATLDEPFWHALLHRVMARVEQPGTVTVDQRPSARVLWNHLVRDHVPEADLPQVEKAWRTWNNAHRRMKKHNPDLHHELGLAIEYRRLKALVDVPQPAGDQEPVARRRL